MSNKKVTDMSRLTCQYEGEIVEESLDVSNIEGIITDDSIKDFQNHTAPKWYEHGMMKTIKDFDNTPTVIEDDATRQMMLHAIVDQVFEKVHHDKNYDRREPNGDYVLTALVSHRVFKTIDANNTSMHFPKEYYIEDAASPIIYANDIFEERNGRHFMIGRSPGRPFTSVQYGFLSVTIPEDIFDVDVEKKYGMTRQIFTEIQGPLSDKNILAIYNKVINLRAYAVLNINFEKLIIDHPDIVWEFIPYHGDDGEQLHYIGQYENDGNGVVSICGQMGSLNK